MVNRTALFQKRGKKVDDNITLVLTYHPALNQVYEILQRAYKHILKPPRLLSALPSPPRVAFRNAKTIRDKLVRSKLKEFIYTGINICCHSNCDICKILENGDRFESTVTKKKYRINFPFDCNSICLVYLLTCKVYLKQYVGSTVTMFRLRFNQYKSNIKLYRERRRAFKQEELIDYFFLCSQNGTHKDIKVQIIYHCDPNDQEAREDFWIFHLDTLHPKVLNQKRALKS